MSTEVDLIIVESGDRRRFEATVEGERAHLTFGRDHDRIWLLDTFVPPPLEGRGIGGQLARHGLDYARAHGLAVVPICPFVVAYLERHPEYHDLVR